MEGKICKTTGSIWNKWIFLFRNLVIMPYAGKLPNVRLINPYINTFNLLTLAGICRNCI